MLHRGICKYLPYFNSQSDEALQMSDSFGESSISKKRKLSIARENLYEDDEYIENRTRTNDYEKDDSAANYQSKISRHKSHHSRSPSPSRYDYAESDSDHSHDDSSYRSVNQYPITSVLREIALLIKDRKASSSARKNTQPFQASLSSVETYLTEVGSCSSSLESIVEDSERITRSGLDSDDSSTSTLTPDQIDEKLRTSRVLSARQRERVLYSQSTMATFLDFISCMPSDKQAQAYNEISDSSLGAVPLLPLPELLISLGYGNTIFSRTFSVSGENTDLNSSNQYARDLCDDFSMSSFVMSLLLSRAHVGELRASSEESSHLYSSLLAALGSRATTSGPASCLNAILCLALEENESHRGESTKNQTTGSFMRVTAELWKEYKIYCSTYSFTTAEKYIQSRETNPWFLQKFGSPNLEFVPQDNQSKNVKQISEGVEKASMTTNLSQKNYCFSEPQNWSVRQRSWSVLASRFLRQLTQDNDKATLTYDHFSRINQAMFFPSSSLSTSMSSPFLPTNDGAPLSSPAGTASLSQFWVRLGNLPGEVTSASLLAAFSGLWKGVQRVFMTPPNSSCGSSSSAIVFFSTKSAADCAIQWVIDNQLDDASWALPLKIPFLKAAMKVLDSYKTYTQSSGSLATTSSFISTMFSPAYQILNKPGLSETDGKTTCVIVPPIPGYPLIPSALMQDKSCLLRCVTASLSLCHLMDIQKGLLSVFPPPSVMGLDSESEKNQKVALDHIPPVSISSHTFQPKSGYSAKSAFSTTSDTSYSLNSELGISEKKLGLMYPGARFLFTFSPAESQSLLDGYTCDITNWTEEQLRTVFAITTQYLLSVHLFCFFTGSQFRSAEEAAVLVGFTGPLCPSPEAAVSITNMTKNIGELFENSSIEGKQGIMADKTTGDILAELRSHPFLFSRVKSLLSKLSALYGGTSIVDNNQNKIILKYIDKVMYMTLVQHVVVISQVFTTPFIYPIGCPTVDNGVVTSPLTLAQHVANDFVRRSLPFYASTQLEEMSVGKVRCKLCKKVFKNAVLGAQHLLLSPAHALEVRSVVEDAIRVVYSRRITADFGCHLPLGLPLDARSFRFSESSLVPTLRKTWSNINCGHKIIVPVSSEIAKQRVNNADEGYESDDDNDLMEDRKRDRQTETDKTQKKNSEKRVNIVVHVPVSVSASVSTSAQGPTVSSTSTNSSRILNVSEYSFVDNLPHLMSEDFPTFKLPLSAIKK